MSLLQCQHLTVTVANKTVCQQFDWTIDAGQFWVVLGQNGVGKTSLLHSLLGLRPVNQGTLLLADKPLTSYRPAQRATLLGLLLQQETPAFPCTVADAVMAGRYPHMPYWRGPNQVDKDTVRDNLEYMALTGLEKQCITTLSGGELQRVQLATILSQSPSVYLLDEPLTHLDIKHQFTVMQHFQRLCQEQNAAVVMVLHDVQLARHFATHVLAMYGDGRNVLGEQHVILNKEQLTALYQCEAIDLFATVD